MLGMNEGFPDPDRKDDVVPALEFKLMALMLSQLEVFLTKVFNFLLIKLLILLI